MRLNQFIAQATGLSRRSADKAIEAGRIRVNGQPPQLGQKVDEQDTVSLDGTPLDALTSHTTIMLHKPTGYVVSRDGQGGHSIYELLPPSLHNLKPVGRLDKDSSGLLLLTDDGVLANELTHPRSEKTKRYHVTLHKPLTPHDSRQIEAGVMLEDGSSQLKLEGEGKVWVVRMHEGRNRQIRRTFAALGYRVVKLHRTDFGPYALDGLAAGSYRQA